MFRINNTVTLSSNSFRGVYKFKIFTICNSKITCGQNMLFIKRYALLRWDQLTCWVVRLLHSEQMASASWLVFFFTCSSWAAWMMGSRVAAALLWYKLFALSHSSIWVVLYLNAQRDTFLRAAGSTGSPVLQGRVPELHAIAPWAHIFA